MTGSAFPCSRRCCAFSSTWCATAGAQCRRRSSCARSGPARPWGKDPSPAPCTRRDGPNNPPDGEGPIRNVRGVGYRFVWQVREHEVASTDLAPLSSSVETSATVDAAFLDKLARARTFDEVTGATADAMRGTFGTHVGTVGFLDRSLKTTSRLYYGMRLSDCEEYERYWRDRDRLFLRVIGRPVPTDNWQVHSRESWRIDPVFTEYAKRLSVWHYMAVPILARAAA